MAKPQTRAELQLIIDSLRSDLSRERADKDNIIKLVNKEGYYTTKSLLNIVSETVTERESLRAENFRLVNENNKLWYLVRIALKDENVTRQVEMEVDQFGNQKAKNMPLTPFM